MQVVLSDTFLRRCCMLGDFHMFTDTLAENFY